MKVKVPLLLLLILAGSVGYLLGTDKGRQQRDAIAGKIRNRGTLDEAAGAVFEEAATPEPDSGDQPTVGAESPADPGTS